MGSEPPPATTVWPAGHAMVRVHDSAFGATEPHPGPSRHKANGHIWPRTRFAHFRHSAAASWVPTVYGATSDTTAVAEVILRGQDLTPSGEAPQVRLRRVEAHLISTIAPARDLVLIDLGEASAFTSTGPAGYPLSVAEARRLHLTNPQVDGLIWPSWQHPGGVACVLWVDEPLARRRVSRRDLRVVAQPVPVVSPPGLDRLMAAAEELGVIVVPPSS